MLLTKNIKALILDVDGTLISGNKPVLSSDIKDWILNSKKYFYSAAFASKVVDKIGAGDAMLGILSLCLKKNFDKNFSLLVGSLAAAQSVETIGNSVAVNKNQILKSIQYLLK